MQRSCDSFKDKTVSLSCLSCYSYDIKHYGKMPSINLFAGRKVDILAMINLYS